LQTQVQKMVLLLVCRRDKKFLFFSILNGLNDSIGTGIQHIIMRFTSNVVLNWIVVQIDADAQKMMESLRKDKILRSSMDVRNISFFRIKWNDVENRNPSDDPDYLQRFSEAFCKKVGELLEIWDRNVLQLRLVDRSIIRLFQAL